MFTYVQNQILTNHDKPDICSKARIHIHKNITQSSRGIEIDHDIRIGTKDKTFVYTGSKLMECGAYHLCCILKPFIWYNKLLQFSFVVEDIKQWIIFAVAKVVY